MTTFEINERLFQELKGKVVIITGAARPRPRPPPPFLSIDSFQPHVKG
jgi:hypothetical protein